MGLFDRFRAQPVWKHRDPNLRLAAVEELSLDEQATLGAIAREDGDPRVRRAAVKKLYNAAEIAAVRDADQDPGVREEANTVLMDIARGAFEGTQESDSFAALAFLGEAKDLVAVAKEASSTRVALAALARVSDEKGVGSIARRSAHGAVRMAALNRVTDPDEIAAIALRSEFKDVSVAAAERLEATDALEGIVARAKNRAAARQAKMMLRARAAAPAAADTAATAPAPVEPGSTSDTALCQRVEELAASATRPHAVARLEQIEAAWNAREPADDALRARFETAAAAVRQAVAAHEAAERDRAARAEAVRAETAHRVAVCEQVEGLAGSPADDLLSRLDIIVKAWQDAPLPDDFPGRAALGERFERAVVTARRAHEQAQALAARRRRLEGLVEEADRVSRAENLAEARTRFVALRQEWAAALAGGSAGEDLVARFGEADAHVRAREQDAREERARKEREHLVRVKQLADELEALARGDGLTLRDAERAARELRAALDNPGPMPSRRDREEMAERLKAIQTALLPRLQELKDADDWQRWANATIQEELCAKAERLVHVEDAAEAARELRALQAQWKNVSAAPRDQSQALWLRFKAAQDAVRERVDRYFTAQAEERAGNLQRKEALCQKAESLAESSDWIKTAEAIKQLQAEWKDIGPVPRGQEKATWERFRAACDRFFTRRREDLSRRKEEWARNLARKEALIARVEALATPEDWEKAVDEVRRLQGEWRAVGPVRRKHTDELWQRFQQATTRFFERYAERDELQMASNTANREAICLALETLLPAPAPGPAAETAPAETAEAPAGGTVMPTHEAVVAGLRAAWADWEKAGPVPAEVLAAATERFRKAFAAVVTAYPDSVRGSEFDPEANLRKMESLCDRVEKLAPAPAAAGMEQTPAAILATRWREALASNTIGGAAALATEDARRRAASEAVREAQAAWKRIGPVPEDLARPLAVRFQRACIKVFEHGRNRHLPGGQRRG